MEDEARFTIGTLASSAGVNVETIRYYQRRGLMRETRRAPGGIRRYGDADLGRLSFIRSAQRLGFSLDEVGELLRLEDGERCAEARAIGERRLRDVRERLRELRRIEAALGSLVARCGEGRGSVRCPLIGSLKSR